MAEKILPASGYLSDPGRSEGEMKTALEDQRDVIAQVPGAVPETTLTIATGVITPVAGIHTVDTEGGSPSDDLTNILYSNHENGSMLLIHSANNARTVVIKDTAGGAGEIATKDGNDITLDDTTIWVMLKRTTTQWEVMDVFATQRSILTPDFDSGWQTTTGTWAYTNGIFLINQTPPGNYQNWFIKVMNKEASNNKLTDQLVRTDGSPASTNEQTARLIDGTGFTVSDAGGWGTSVYPWRLRIWGE